MRALDNFAKLVDTTHGKQEHASRKKKKGVVVRLDYLSSTWFWSMTVPIAEREARIAISCIAKLRLESFFSTNRAALRKLSRDDVEGGTGGGPPGCCRVFRASLVSVRSGAVAPHPTIRWCPALTKLVSVASLATVKSVAVAQHTTIRW
jgi:hypothetical protein